MGSDYLRKLSNLTENLKWFKSLFISYFKNLGFEISF